ncbi:CHAP domain-containing protein [Spirosoma areae]
MATQVVERAKGELGVHEIRGHNDSPRIDEYRSLTLNKKVKGWRDAWCAYYVAWCYKTGGGKIPKTCKNPAQAAQWFLDNKAYVYSKRKIVPGKPRPGDVVGYRFRSGRISHIGIIVEWPDGKDYYISMEGNTGTSSTVYRDNNRNDAVRMKRRPKAMAYLVASTLYEEPKK